MHQVHNIPWRNLSSNITYEPSDAEYTNPKVRTSVPKFTFLNRAAQSGELNHFARKLISTIHSFALTERGKYPSAHELKAPPADGLLFSTELMEKYPEYLNEKNRSLESWTSRSHWLRSLDEVVGILLHENQMDTLLMLANHPSVHLSALHSDGFRDYPLGFNVVAKHALEAYLVWNLVGAAGYLASGTYRDMEIMKFLVCRRVHRSSSAASEIPHREFYSKILDLDTLNGWSDLRELKVPIVHQGVGLESLGAYLKHLFEILYRYEMLMTECGLHWERNWEEIFVSSIWEFFDVAHASWNLEGIRRGESS